MDRPSFQFDAHSTDTLFNRTADNALAVSALIERACRGLKGHLPQPDVIASLDTEWVNGAHAEVALPDTDNQLLCYTLTIMNRVTKRYSSLVMPVGGPTHRSRFTLKQLLTAALSDAIAKGVIDRVPERLGLAAHFSRADLSTLREWKVLKTRVDSVRRTFATTTRPHVLTLGSGVRISIIVVDTMLLAPANTPLKTLGDVLGEPKIELREGEIEHMRAFMESDPLRFNAYAIQDTVIAAKWADRVWTLLTHKFNVNGHVPTLGSAGVHMVEGMFKTLNLNRDHYFGYERVRGKPHILSGLEDAWGFAANCYHGARNEAYWVGHSPLHTPLHDADIIGAYSTALAMLRVPDWASARAETDLTQLAVIDEALTFARVRFRFPAGTRFPALPVRAGSRGLVYPLAGKSWCTGPELVVARAQGAEIEMEAGLRIEWTDDDVHPFADFTRTINRIRAEAKTQGDEVLNKLAKEIGNSLYGKIAQAVELSRTVTDGGARAPRGKRVFDSRSGSMKTLPPSRITNPMFAAFVTGMVRALLSETLARLPADAVVMSATTDGLLSSIPVDRLDTSGPLAAAFKRARSAIAAGDDTIWEEKHAVARVLAVKTRGTISVAGDPASKPILAKAGFRLSERYTDPWSECAAWVKVHRERTYDTVLTGRSLIDLRTQWMTDADLIEVPRQTRLNHDFDLKRALVAPRDEEDVLCADTRPHESVEAFDQARDDLEAWKKSQRRVLKTTRDYTDMLTWTVERPGQRAAGSTAQSGRPALVNAFMRAAAHGDLGLGDRRYSEIAAFISGCGWPVSEMTLKNAKRRGALTLGQARRLTDAEERFAAQVFATYPDCELERFAAEGSPARAALEALKRRDTTGPPEVQRCHTTFPPIAQATFCSAQQRQTGDKPLKPKRGVACARRPVLGRAARANAHYVDRGNTDVANLLRSGSCVPLQQARAWEAILTRLRC